MATGFETTNLHDHVPYHKLTVAQGKAWCFPRHLGGDEIRRKMADQLAKMYPRHGCGLCSATMALVAYIMPDGRFRMLVAPFKRIPIDAIANKPQSDCPCQNFLDPESGGPWKKNGRGGHHPMCQFERGSSEVFAKTYQALHGGVDFTDGGKVLRAGKRVVSKARPDLMLKIQQQVRGR